MSPFPSRLSLLLISSIFFLTACANDNPDASAVDSKIVYDFKDEENFPELRLSVFVSLESSAQMSSSIKLVNEENNLEWSCKASSLRKIEFNDFKMVGSTNFVPAQNELFPAGKYKIVYEDLAERESESSFELAYPDELAQKKAKDFPACFTSPASKKIAVYSNEDVLLYFGDVLPEWQKSEDIIMNFKNAWCSRDCYVLNGNSVYCLMPPVLLGNKDFIKETSEDKTSENK